MHVIFFLLVMSVYSCFRMRASHIHFSSMSQKSQDLFRKHLRHRHQRRKKLWRQFTSLRLCLKSEQLQGVQVLFQVCYLLCWKSFQNLPVSYNLCQLHIGQFCNVFRSRQMKVFNKTVPLSHNLPKLWILHFLIFLILSHNGLTKLQLVVKRSQNATQQTMQ